MKKELIIETEKIKEDIEKSKEKQLTFKNYPQFCEYLKIQKKTGRNKVLQINNLHTMIEFEKREDNSYIIRNVFPPIFSKKSKDLKQITEYTILAYLLTKGKESERCSISVKYLAEMLGYITLKYKYFYDHPKELAQKTNISIETIYEFFDKTHDIYNRYIKESLSILEQYKMLFVSKKYYGIKYSTKENLDKILKRTEYGDEEIEYTNINQDYRELSEYEIKQVLRIERETFFEVMEYERTEEEQKKYLQELKDNHISLLRCLYKKKKTEEYYNKRQQKLIEELNLFSAYQVYDIIYDYELIFSTFQYTYKKLEEKGIIDALYYDATNNIIDTAKNKLMVNTERRHEKKKEEMEKSSKEEKEKEKMTKIIDRSTREFHQILNLLIYQQKNQEEKYKEYSKKNYISEEQFEEQFNEKMKIIEKRNNNFHERNKKLYK